MKCPTCQREVEDQEYAGGYCSYGCEKRGHDLSMQLMQAMIIPKKPPALAKPVEKLEDRKEGTSGS